MMAHALRLLNYEPQRFSRHEYLNAGARREEPPPQEERGFDPPSDDSLGRSSSPLRCPQRPLKCDNDLPKRKDGVHETQGVREFVAS